MNIPKDSLLIAETGFNNLTGISSNRMNGLPYKLNGNANSQGNRESEWKSNWEGTPSLAVVQDKLVFEGDGALWIKSDQANVSRQFRTENGKFVMEQHVRLPDGGNLVARVRDESFGPFSKMGIAAQWGASKGGDFTVVDGVGDGCSSGECDIENTGISWKADEWYKVSDLLDVSSQTYEFFVNAVRYDAPDPLGFRGRPEKLDEVHDATPTAAVADIDALRVIKSSDSAGIIRHLKGYPAAVNDVKFSQGRSDCILPISIFEVGFPLLDSHLLRMSENK